MKVVAMININPNDKIYFKVKLYFEEKMSYINTRSKTYDLDRTCLILFK